MAKKKDESLNSHGTTENVLNEKYPELKKWIKLSEFKSIKDLFLNQENLLKAKTLLSKDENLFHFGTETGLNFLREKCKLVALIA